MLKLKYHTPININMARYHKPALSQRMAGGIGNIGSTAIKIKRTVTHPHEEAIYYSSRKLIDYSKRGTGLKGPIRDRVQVYNKKIGKFVKIDTKSSKILGSSKNPYKRVRRK